MSPCYMHICKSCCNHTHALVYSHLWRGYPKQIADVLRPMETSASEQSFPLRVSCFSMWIPLEEMTSTSYEAWLQHEGDDFAPFYTLTCQDELPPIHKKKQVTSVTRLANKFPKNVVRKFEPGWPKTLRFYGGSVLPCAQLDAFASERLAMEMHRLEYQMIQVTCRFMLHLFWVIFKYMYMSSYVFLQWYIHHISDILQALIRHCFVPSVERVWLLNVSAKHSMKFSVSLCWFSPTLFLEGPAASWWSWGMRRTNHGFRLLGVDCRVQGVHALLFRWSRLRRPAKTQRSLTESLCSKCPRTS